MEVSSVQDFHQEEALGKAYDGRLMRRLLKYAWPFKNWIALAIVLLLFITGADLVRPYIVKVAIDDHLLAYDEPWAAFAPGTEPAEGVRLSRSLLPGSWPLLNLPLLAPDEVVLVRGPRRARRRPPAGLVPNRGHRRAAAHPLLLD